MEERLNRNKVFSDDNKDTEKIDFQTEHMKNKIKKVKKQTKLLNIKNIEPLVNIHETPSNQEKRTSQTKTQTKAQEGFTFRDDDWTGTDNIYEGGNKGGAAESRSFDKIIEDAYQNMIDGYDKVILSITKTCSSDSKHLNSDKGHLKKYITWILGIVVASIAVYNWCFILFYRDNSNTRINAWNVPRDYISKEASTSPFFWILNLFADIPLFFTDFFKKYVIDWIPDVIMSKIDSETASPLAGSIILFAFMFILASSTFMAYGSGEAIKNVLVDLAKFEFTGVLPILIYTTTAILFIMSFMETNPLAAILPIGRFISFATFLNPTFWIEKVVLLVYLIFLGVPIATATLLSYILFHTFFGFIYNGINIFDMKKKMDEFLNGYKPEDRRDTPCNPLSFFGKVLNFMIKIFNFLYDNCIHIGFMIVMLYTLIDSELNIKNNALKMIIIGITGSYLVLVAILKILSIVMDSSPTTSTTENMETSIPSPSPSPSSYVPTMSPPRNPIETLPNLTDKMTIPTKETLTNMAENLNVNDNIKLQDGLKQMGNIASTLNSLKN